VFGCEEARRVLGWEEVELGGERVIFPQRTASFSVLFFLHVGLHSPLAPSLTMKIVVSLGGWIPPPVKTGSI